MADSDHSHINTEPYRSMGSARSTPDLSFTSGDPDSPRERLTEFAWAKQCMNSGGAVDTNPFAPKPPPLYTRSLRCRTIVKGNEPLSTLYDEMVFILVGPEETKFGAHKGILCQYSSYFRAALSGCFKEAEEGVATLPEDDPVLFKIFITWLYSRRLRVTLPNGKDTPCQALDLVKLFVFGDVRGIPALRNDVIDAFVKERHTVHKEVIPYLYDNTPESSPLRKLFVDLINWQYKMSATVKKGIFHPDRDTLPYFTREFMMELLIAREQIPRPILKKNSPFSRRRCSFREIPSYPEKCYVPYHEHPEMEPNTLRNSEERTFGNI